MHDAQQVAQTVQWPSCENSQRTHKRVNMLLFRGQPRCQQHQQQLSLFVETYSQDVRFAWKPWVEPNRQTNPAQPGSRARSQTSTKWCEREKHDNLANEQKEYKNQTRHSKTGYKDQTAGTRTERGRAHKDRGHRRGQRLQKRRKIITQKSFTCPITTTEGRGGVRWAEGSYEKSEWYDQ